MRSAVRKPRSFSLDPEVLAEVDRTRGDDSTSERVNQLLKFALQLERKASLEEEAAQFFSAASTDEAERRAFQKAAARTWTRE